MIELGQVSKWYGGFRALDNCSLKVERGEVVVLCGPSGSGKSTLLKTINGLETIQQGRILVEGVEVSASGIDLPKLRTRVGMVPQHVELFPHLSVLENLTLAQTKVLRRDRQQAVDKALHCLRQVALQDYADRLPAQLSGGQQQRVAIARALAMDPVVLLLDEPTSALDPETIGDVLALLGELAEQGMTMLLITHEMGFARKVASRMVFMDKGAIVEESPTDSFFASPQLDRTRAFLAKILR